MFPGIGSVLSVAARTGVNPLKKFIQWGNVPFYQHLRKPSDPEVLLLNKVIETVNAKATYNPDKRILTAISLLKKEKGVISDDEYIQRLVEIGQRAVDDLIYGHAMMTRNDKYYHLNRFIGSLYVLEALEASGMLGGLHSLISKIFQRVNNNEELLIAYYTFQDIYEQIHPKDLQEIYLGAMKRILAEHIDENNKKEKKKIELPEQQQNLLNELFAIYGKRKQVQTTTGETETKIVVEKQEEVWEKIAYDLLLEYLPYHDDERNEHLANKIITTLEQYDIRGKEKAKFVLKILEQGAFDITYYNQDITQILSSLKSFSVNVPVLNAVPGKKGKGVTAKKNLYLMHASSLSLSEQKQQELIKKIAKNYNKEIIAKAGSARFTYNSYEVYIIKDINDLHYIYHKYLASKDLAEWRNIILAMEEDVVAALRSVQHLAFSSDIISQVKRLVSVFAPDMVTYINEHNATLVLSDVLTMLLGVDMALDGGNLAAEFFNEKQLSNFLQKGNAGAILIDLLTATNKKAQQFQDAVRNAVIANDKAKMVEILHNKLISLGVTKGVSQMVLGILKGGGLIGTGVLMAIAFNNNPGVAISLAVLLSVVAMMYTLNHVIRAGKIIREMASSSVPSKLADRIIAMQEHLYERYGLGRNNFELIGNKEYLPYDKYIAFIGKDLYKKVVLRLKKEEEEEADPNMRKFILDNSSLIKSVVSTLQAIDKVHEKNPVWASKKNFMEMLKHDWTNTMSLLSEFDEAKHNLKILGKKTKKLIKQWEQGVRDNIIERKIKWSVYYLATILADIFRAYTPEMKEEIEFLEQLLKALPEKGIQELQQEILKLITLIEKVPGNILLGKLRVLRYVLPYQKNNKKVVKSIKKEIVSVIKEIKKDIQRLSSDTTNNNIERVTEQATEYLPIFTAFSPARRKELLGIYQDIIKMLESMLKDEKSNNVDALYSIIYILEKVTYAATFDDPMLIHDALLLYREKIQKEHLARLKADNQKIDILKNKLSFLAQKVHNIVFKQLMQTYPEATVFINEVMKQEQETNTLTSIRQLVADLFKLKETIDQQKMDLKVTVENLKALLHTIEKEMGNEVPNSLFRITAFLKQIELFLQTMGKNSQDETKEIEKAFSQLAQQAQGLLNDLAKELAVGDFKDEQKQAIQKFAQEYKSMYNNLMKQTISNIADKFVQYDTRIGPNSEENIVESILGSEL